MDIDEHGDRVLHASEHDVPEYWALPGTLSEREISKLLEACEETRYPHRNRTIVLLAAEAGLTAREIAWLQRSSVQTDDGLVGDHIDLFGKPGKRLKSREIPLAENGRLRAAIIKTLASVRGRPNDPLIVSERALDRGGEGGETLNDIPVYAEMRPTSIGYIFWKLADRAGIKHADAGRGARRSFLVKVGRAIKKSGGSARDVQTLAGHRSLANTQKFIEADEKAQRRVIGTLFDIRPDRKF